MKTELSKMVELTDAELDAVAAGQGNNTGLIVVDVDNVLNNNDVNVEVDVLRNADVAVAAAVAVLGAAGAVARA